jgi:hypothetical protein
VTSVLLSHRCTYIGNVRTLCWNTSRREYCRRNTGGMQDLCLTSGVSDFPCFLRFHSFRKIKLDLMFYCLNSTFVCLTIKIMYFILLPTVIIIIIIISIFIFIVILIHDLFIVIEYFVLLHSLHFHHQPIMTIFYSSKSSILHHNDPPLLLQKLRLFYLIYSHLHIITSFLFSLSFIVMFVNTSTNHFCSLITFKVRVLLFYTEHWLRLHLRRVPTSLYLN